jgi:hypothetical protein
MVSEELNNSFAPLIYLLEITVSDVNAQEIYKFVDDEGNVIYSEEPPDELGNVDILESAPEPNVEDVEAAQKRIQELEASSIALDKDVKSQNSEQETLDNKKVASPAGRTYIPVGAPLVRHYRNDLHVMPHRRRR